ncbi:LOW QUALITY PROTEIN: U2 small nuclear ribonucleoprotein auxiliary factor 35 kDa subunit-related protein 2-like [Pollicipes pollicipes]|uniref:LOW QUALITY PROTEIN: U2 small nuclear ribonucleoprotein auxiliary factor 35 kDa subunit-related protein 2-like n=1 Tax=Pollicipes pollicipes TaxID=41117 RepID=UPI00188590C5|nr:LOW QUALITY PROTEIN: U2 small nuclear ribonucleoprotein auxiliary factor 35 kDa subunit-related protein 2-like [Pollicipes pollicipes]
MSEGATSDRQPYKVWRKQWKKMRRKKLRQMSAKFRDYFEEKKEKERMKDKAYCAWLQEQEHLEELQEAEENAAMIQRHNAWLDREKQAQLEWQRKKLKEEKEKHARELQEKQIQEEWEAVKKAEEEEKRAREEEDQRRKQRQEALLQEALSGLEGSAPTENPPVPTSEERTVETRPGLPLCPFFEKTGCCRFGSRCSRNHPHVLLGRCLLLEHLYQPLGMRFTQDDEHNLDVGLEFDDRERAEHFDDFYGDVLPELRSCGEVVQFKVCQNYEPHLRGNVYVQYATENEAARAFTIFNGRWYGGQQISARFVDIQRWSRAICGAFFKGTCPKGRNCNFLHVYKNPGSEFWRADRDMPSGVAMPSRDWSTSRRHDRNQSAGHRRGRHDSSDMERDSSRRSHASRRRDGESRNRHRSPPSDREARVRGGDGDAISRMSSPSRTDRAKSSERRRDRSGRRPSRNRDSELTHVSSRRGSSSRERSTGRRERGSSQTPERHRSRSRDKLSQSLKLNPKRSNDHGSSRSRHRHSGGGDDTRPRKRRHRAPDPDEDRAPGDDGDLPVTAGPDGADRRGTAGRAEGRCEGDGDPPQDGAASADGTAAESDLPLPSTSTGPPGRR